MRLASPDVHPTGDATQVRLPVRLACAVGVGEAHRGRIRLARPPKAGAQVLGQVVDEPQLGVPGGVDRLGMESALDMRGLAATLDFQLDGHDVSGQRLEEEALSLGAAAVVDLLPGAHSGVPFLRG